MSNGQHSLLLLMFVAVFVIVPVCLVRVHTPTHITLRSVPNAHLEHSMMQLAKPLAEIVQQAALHLKQVASQQPRGHA
jgi:hypothetical protein